MWLKAVDQNEGSVRDQDVKRRAAQSRLVDCKGDEKEVRERIEEEHRDEAGDIEVERRRAPVGGFAMHYVEEKA